MKPFKLETYLTQYEFSSPFMLCGSDVEGWKMSDVLALANTDQIERWDNLSLAYTEPFGAPKLRALIATTLYTNLHANHILCFAGAEEAIYSCLKVLCNKDDHAIIITPCYQSLYEIPASNCGKVDAIPLEENNNWRIEIAKIENAIQHNTKCIVINFPHNPTGQVISETEISALVELCHKYDIWLFSDEVYRFLGTPPNGWAASAVDCYEKGISLGVMSKAFGMPGLRVGWIACQDVEMLEQFKQYKDYLSICNSAPSELLTEIALSNAAKVLEINNQLVTKNFNQLQKFMEKHNELFSWIIPNGGCIGFIRLLADTKVKKMCHDLVEKKGVLLLPANVYELQSNHFRIGYGRKNFSEALGIFEQYIHENF